MAKKDFSFPPRPGDSAEICLVGASIRGLPTRPRGHIFLFVACEYVELVQERNGHFNPNVTMKMPLHGIFPSIVTNALLGSFFLSGPPPIQNKSSNQNLGTPSVGPQNGALKPPSTFFR